MKKLLLLCGAIGSSIVTAQAQSSAIKINPTSLLVATFNASFEHAVSDKSSFQIGAFYTGFSVVDTKFSGFGITPEYRIYLTGEAMQGFFVAPYLRYQNFTLTNPEYTDYDSSGQPFTTRDEASLNTFGGGINTGYQWIFGEHFVLEPFLRLGYSGGSVKLVSGNDNFSTGSFDGLSVLPGLNIGYAF